MTVERIEALLVTEAADGFKSVIQRPLRLASTMREVAAASAAANYVVIALHARRVMVSFTDDGHLEVKLLFETEALSFPAEPVTDEPLRRFLLRWHRQACSLTFAPDPIF